MWLKYRTTVYKLGFLQDFVLKMGRRMTDSLLTTGTIYFFYIASFLISITVAITIVEQSNDTSTVQGKSETFFCTSDKM